MLQKQIVILDGNETSGLFAGTFDVYVEGSELVNQTGDSWRDAGSHSDVQWEAVRQIVYAGRTVLD